MTDPLTLTAVHPSGFAVCLHVSSLDVLDATIADLLQRGYRPTSGTGEQWARTPTGEPICPKHHVVMRLRQKQSDEWWSHRVIHRETGEELFCKGYRAPGSLGWEIEDTDAANP